MLAQQAVELQKAAEIETVCAWCGKHLSGVEGATPERVSHGICDSCRRAVEAELGMEVTA